MRAVSTATSAARHSVVALAEGILIAAIVAALIMAFAPILKPADQLAGAQTVLAAKGDNGKGGGGGGKGGGSSLSLVVLDGDDAVPNHGERVTFDVTTTATDRPFVDLQCWQGSTGVYYKSIGIFPTYLFDPWFTLDSVYWQAGESADCTARLYHYDKRGNIKFLATMGFAVAP